MPAKSFDEVSDLLSRFGVDDTAKFWRAARRIAKHAAVIGNHSDLYAAYARVPGNDLFGIVRLKLVQMSFVEQTIQKLAHAVRLTMIFGNDVIESFFRSLRLIPSLCLRFVTPPLPFGRGGQAGEGPRCVLPLRILSVA